MDNEQDIKSRTCPERYETELTMMGIFNCECVFVFEGNDGISKIYAMFTQTGFCLPWVPPNFQLVRVCTISA